MRVAFRIGVCLVFLLAAPLLAAATVLVVSPDGSADYRTIRGAMNAAAFGDILRVAGGVYEEQVVLKNGVTVVGAGPQQTVVRYSYGFDPVLVIDHVSSGRIEGMTIERGASILEGPVVMVTAGSADLADCVISGGMGPGVDVGDLASNLALESVAIEDNAGAGISVHDGARVTLDGCTVLGNEGVGAWVRDHGQLEATGSRFESNEGGGVALEASATASLDGCEITGHAASGLLVAGDARIVASDLTVTKSGSGAVRLTSRALGQFTRLRVEGGSGGVGCEDEATCTVDGGRFDAVDGTSLHATGTASISARTCEVVGGGGDGVVFESATRCRLTYSTVARNAGDGVRISGGDVEVGHCILAYNRGAGLRADVSGDASSVRAFSHNCVWGNGTDYVGTARRPSDVAAAPGFAHLPSGDVSLRLDSPCIEAGVGWTTIGAQEDPSSASSWAVELVSSASRGWFGETWHADLRLAGSPFEIASLDLGLRFHEGGVALDIESTVLGRLSRRVAASGSLSKAWPQGGGSEALTVECGFAGVIQSDESWGAVWGLAALEGGAVGASFRVATNWPSPHLSARLQLAFALSSWRLEASLAAVDVTLTALDIALSQGLGAGARRLRLEERVQLLPDRVLAATAEWAGDGWNWTGLVEIADEAWRARLTLADRGFSVTGKARLVGWSLSEGSVSATARLGSVTLSGELALSTSDGPRVATGVAFDPTAWLRRRPNEPPIPAFSALPADPEAGTPVQFRASGSADPDGQIRVLVWDFGDGAVGEGPSVDHAYAAAGIYDVVLTVSDDRGAAVSLTLPVTVWPADTSPVAAFVAVAVSEGGVRLPRGPRAGDGVLLDASGSSDADGSVVEYSWDFESDGVIDAVSSDPTIIAPALAAAAHPITLRVVDDTSRSDAVMRVVLVDQVEPPRAAFSFTPPTPAIQDPVYFSDRSVDTDGSVIAWIWDFGDGRSSRDASPVHRFSVEGEYTVRLTVRDSDGLEATESRSVVVSPTPEIVPVDEVWAVVIGISDYAQVKDLQYGRDDAIAMYRWLVDSGVAEDHVRLLLDSEGPVAAFPGAAPRLASLVNVREALGWLRRVAEEDDLALVSFSGHGFQGDDDNGDEQDGVDEFFVLVDTSASAVEDTALRDDEFGRFLDRLESNHVLVLFDGCYSGGLSRSLPSSKRPIGDRPDLFSDFALEGRLILSAAAEAQEAFESPEVGHGVFTYCVIAGLRGAADLNGDRRVTAWELYEYVARAVPERVRRERGAVQEPQLAGEGEVRVLLATADRPPAVAFTYGPDLPYAGSPVQFADQTRADRGVETYAWSFGDGSTSNERSPTHAYDAEGEYSVDLRVTDARGVVGSAASRVAVGPAGRVLSIDAATGSVLVSLGEENGLRVGDRFETSRSASELEVVELVGGDSAACRVLRGDPPAVDESLRPMSSGAVFPTPPAPG
ncbi:MAG: PKD domain-containing protein [Candidatus Bipolaricaulis sp.]|nr:PKD domain-containing protein [Candidatus Bipolaricaulis sp.]